MSDTQSAPTRSARLRRPGPALDPQVTAADVRIESLRIHSSRALTRVRHEIDIEVASDNDDSALNVRCVVVLPPTAELLDSDPPALRGPAFPALGDAEHAVQSAPTTGFVIFALPAPLAVGERLTLRLTVSVQITYARVPIAAFVHSDNPDPNPANNFLSVDPPAPVGH